MPTLLNAGGGLVQTLSENTQVSLWLAVIVGLFVLGIVVKVNNKLNAIGNRLTAMENSRRETWTRTHQKIFALELEKRNREIQVPDPYIIAPLVESGNADGDAA